MTTTRTARGAMVRRRRRFVSTLAVLAFAPALIPHILRGDGIWFLCLLSAIAFMIGCLVAKPVDGTR